MNTSRLMAFIIEYFDDAQNLPSIAISVWSSELNKLSDVQRDQLVIECCKLPKGASIYPARLLEMVGHAPEEQQAWDIAINALHQGTLENLTPAAYSACREIGMTCRWRHIENRELRHLKKQFIEAVKGYLSGAKTLIPQVSIQPTLPQAQQQYMSQLELKEKIAEFKAKQQAETDAQKTAKILEILENFNK